MYRKRDRMNGFKKPTVRLGDLNPYKEEIYHYRLVERSGGGIGY